MFSAGCASESLLMQTSALGDARLATVQSSETRDERDVDLVAPRSFGGHDFAISVPDSRTAISRSQTPRHAIRLKRPEPLISDSKAAESGRSWPETGSERSPFAPDPQIIPGMTHRSRNSEIAAPAKVPVPSNRTKILPPDRVNQATDSIEEYEAQAVVEPLPEAVIESADMKAVSSERIFATESLAQPERLASQFATPTLPDGTSPDAAASVVEPGMDSSVAEREPTMLDRLRDLYSPRRDDNPSDVFRKQFRRLQNPWGLLRDRESEQPQSAVQSADASGTEPVPAEVREPSEVVSGNTESRGLELLIAEIEAELEAWPRDQSGRPEHSSVWRRRQTDLRLLYLIADRSGDAVSAIELLPADEQEFWQAMMLAMACYRGLHADEDREERLAATADQLRSAVRHASSLSPLQIQRIAFCSAINSFGNVDTFPTADFHPGQPVLIYAEVQNFRSERTVEGHWRSRFSAVLEICRNDETQPIESIRIEEITDESTSPRTDYFQSYELTVPQLARGLYTVRISLRDTISQHQTTSSLEFNIR